ncbi:MAG: DUF3332 domain-containing protein [Bacteroidales bacterium]|nr:DUF3332 domain-containing protein [Bacteroidales bacterium]
MKKATLKVSAIFLSCAILFSSCIGSFALTNKVKDWNMNIGGKFVNELVFICFHIIPVYEITQLADILVINSIEFWTDSNPVAFENQLIEGQHGKFYISSTENGYNITNEAGKVIELRFSKKNKTWSAKVDGQKIDFLTFVDENHVKVYGSDNLIEINTNANKEEL